MPEGIIRDWTSSIFYALGAMLARKSIYLESSERPSVDSRAEELAVLRRISRVTTIREAKDIRKIRASLRGVLNSKLGNLDPSDRGMQIDSREQEPRVRDPAPDDMRKSHQT